MESARLRTAGNGARARRLHFLALARFRSESFYWRDLAFGCNGSASLLVADDGTTEFRDFVVDRVKGAFGELLRWREIFLKISYVLLGAFDLI